MHLGRLSGWPFAFLGERYTESPRVGIGAGGVSVMWIGAWVSVAQSKSQIATAIVAKR